MTAVPRLLLYCVWKSIQFCFIYASGTRSLTPPPPLQTLPKVRTSAVLDSELVSPVFRKWVMVTMLPIPRATGSATTNHFGVQRLHHCLSVQQLVNNSDPRATLGKRSVEEANVQAGPKMVNVEFNKYVDNTVNAKMKAMQPVCMCCDGMWVATYWVLLQRLENTKGRRRCGLSNGPE